MVAYKRIVFCFTLLWSFGSVSAQPDTVIALSSSDIALFIESYAPLNEELRVLGEKYSADLENPASAQLVNEAADAVFRKYGWGDGYMRKYNAVFSAFTYVAIEKQLAGSPEKLRESMGSLLPEFKKNTNDNDISLVREKYDQLNVLIGTPRP